MATRHWHITRGDKSQFTRSEPGYRVRGESDRLRQYLAKAPADEYAHALAVAHELAEQEVLLVDDLAFLFPTEPRWVKDSIARHQSTYVSLRLLSVVREPAQLDHLLAHCRHPPGVRGPELAALIEGIGVAAIPYLAAWLNGQVSPKHPGGRALSADMSKTIAAALGAIGTKDALEALIEHSGTTHVLTALRHAVNQHPHVAIRVLARRAVGTGAHVKKAGDLFTAAVLAHPDVAAKLAPSLGAAEKALLIHANQPSAPAKPVAPRKRVPALLVDPPWNHRLPHPDKAIVTDLVVKSRKVTTTVALDPTPGSYEPTCNHRHDGEPDWSALVQTFGTEYRRRDIKERMCGESWFVRCAPVELLTDALQRWEPTGLHGSDWWIETFEDFTRRLGPQALVALVKLLELLRPPGSTRYGLKAEQWSRALDTLVTFDAVEFAPTIVQALENDYGRDIAIDWLDSHRQTAITGLIPDAVGPLGPERANAIQAIEYIATTHEKMVLRIAGSYGADTKVAVEQILAFDEFQLLPATMPTVPDCISQSALTTPLLAGGKHRLPPEAVENLLLMLAISSSDSPYAAIAPVVELLDRPSLSSFAMDLFDGWESAGFPNKSAWILDAQGLLGNDDTVRRLVPYIKRWPGQSAHKRATRGLDALAAIGTDLALLHIHGIGHKVRFKSLRKRAAGLVAAVATDRGLTELELSDRLVPDLGLDASGSMELNYGRRTFVVGFNEALKPFVRDQDGKILKTLPKPGKADDAELAPASYKRFAALKKDARSTAADQVYRLEEAMLTRRRWTQAEFVDLFVTHPFVVHLVRRLLWGSYRDGTLVTSFRVAEDRTFADAKEQVYVLPADVTVGLPLPTEIDAPALAAWGELLADYELLQPFPQLGRDFLELTKKEKGTRVLDRFDGVTIPIGRVVGLLNKGWATDSAIGGDLSPGIYRSLADSRVYMHLAEGLRLSSLLDSADAVIDGVALEGGKTFGELDPILVSELLRDLTALIAQDE